MRSGPEFSRVRLLTALVIWQLALSSACPQEIIQPKRIAVLNFEDASGANVGASGLGVGSWDVGKGISSQLIEKLMAAGKYTIVDRSMVKQVLDEQNTSELDSMDAYSKAAKIGRGLGLDAMIIGAITRLGADDPGKDSHSRMSRRKSKAYAGITARVLDMTTAEVIAEFSATGESAKSGEVVVVRSQGQTKATTQILSSDFANSLLAEATRNAVDKIAVQLNSFAEKIPPLKLEIEGLVADVAKDSVTLNVGRKSGVKVGDKFAILREMPPVAGNQAGEPHPSILHQVSEATVTEVAELYATATCSSSEQVHIGDRVKRITNPQSGPH